MVLPEISIGSPQIPALKGRVNDYAHMLSSSTVEQLTNRLIALEQEDTTQIAVLTIDSLEGYPLEEYSLKVVEAWQLGQKGSDNGALLLIAKNDRKIRIEVGYGLEGTLTDLMAGRIIREIITPKFKDGNFSQGVIDGVEAMVATVKGEFNAENFSSNTGSSASDETIGFLMFFLFTLFNIGRISRKSRLLGIILGGIAVPLIISLFYGLSWLFILLLIPVGGFVGYILSNVIGGISLSSSRSSSGYIGGSRSCSFGGGGFSGGGGGFGGFGGGGSSGGW